MSWSAYSSTSCSYPVLKSCLKAPTLGRKPGHEYDLKKVIFGEITVREYPQILGNNPAVSIGVPITIDWKFQNEYIWEIDIYECARRPLRRSRRRLVISPMKRVIILLTVGYAIEEIADAIYTADQAKAQRIDSIRAATCTRNNGALKFLNGTVETTGTALKATIDVLCVGPKKRSKAILESMTAAMGGIRIRRPMSKKKTIVPPAC